MRKTENRGMTQNADDHREPPAHRLQHPTQDRHRKNFGNLADGHRWLNPVRRDADFAQIAEAIKEEPVVHRGVDERHDKQHEQERMLQQLDRFEPGQRVPLFASGSLPFFGSMRFGGVCGSVKLKAARTSEAMPAVKNAQLIP